MVIYKCPKCGKSYKTKGKYYQDHVKSCTGKASGSISKSQTTTVIFNTQLENIEKRLTSLESNIKKIYLRENIQKSSSTNETIQLKSIIDRLEKLENWKNSTQQKFYDSVKTSDIPQFIKDTRLLKHAIAGKGEIPKSISYSTREELFAKRLDEIMGHKAQKGKKVQAKKKYKK